jgi:hypothetical protein
METHCEALLVGGRLIALDCGPAARAADDMQRDAESWVARSLAWNAGSGKEQRARIR